MIDFDTLIFGLTIRAHLFALAIFAGSAMTLLVLKRFTLKLTSKLDHSSNNLHSLIHECVTKTGILFFVSVSLWASLHALDLGAKAESRLHAVVMIGLFLQVAMWLIQIIDASLATYLKAKSKSVKVDPALQTTLNALKFGCRILVLAITLVVILDNLGFNVTALLTGLGVGGIAVALAVQNILSDLFASLSIVLDKPFVIGDSILVGTDRGVVERIGLRTTRVRAPSGEQLIFCNNDLLNSRVRNFQRMAERRVALQLSVSYKTSIEQLHEIPQIIRSIIDHTPMARFQKAHLQALGPTALQFEVIYFVTDGDYEHYTQVEHGIHIAILETFRARNLDLVYQVPAPNQSSELA